MCLAVKNCCFPARSLSFVSVICNLMAPLALFWVLNSKLPLREVFVKDWLHLINGQSVLSHVHILRTDFFYRLMKSGGINGNVLNIISKK